MLEITSPAPLPDTLAPEAPGTGRPGICNRAFAPIFTGFGPIGVWRTGVCRADGAPIWLMDWAFGAQASPARTASHVWDRALPPDEGPAPGADGARTLVSPSDAALRASERGGRIGGVAAVSAVRGLQGRFLPEQAYTGVTMVFCSGVRYVAITVWGRTRRRYEEGSRSLVRNFASWPFLREYTSASRC